MSIVMKCCSSWHCGPLMRLSCLATTASIPPYPPLCPPLCPSPCPPLHSSSLYLTMRYSHSVIMPVVVPRCGRRRMLSLSVAEVARDLQLSGPIGPRGGREQLAEEENGLHLAVLHVFQPVGSWISQNVIDHDHKAVSFGGVDVYVQPTSRTKMHQNSLHREGALQGFVGFPDVSVVSHPVVVCVYVRVWLIQPQAPTSAIASPHAVELLTVVRNSPRTEVAIRSSPSSAQVPSGS
ncbi:uncharacterized protein BDZ99DRAFT_479006 [Mytilinidion resinicola]|uniref:Uncharacterized protein n=1 Tax=Mytilinidion resinicola TaxID=574789 RepID=A0A6A6YHT3_9PEZI|nr:uncharacterized protein BDZ99DRAFT_479006 [Mytilinidion resinicola]KAF2807555.1 hypothetical protein BDZ99DRAFT_479006 [Mytilinidion resinicola]